MTDHMTVLQEIYRGAVHGAGWELRELSALDWAIAELARLQAREQAGEEVMSALLRVGRTPYACWCYGKPGADHTVECVALRNALAAWRAAAPKGATP